MGLLLKNAGGGNKLPYNPNFIWGIGGTVTTVGNRRIHVMTSNTIFEFINYPAGLLTEILIVGGGGGGGGFAYAGGGQGGNVYYSFDEFTVGNFIVVIGQGGQGNQKVAPYIGYYGQDSSFDFLTALGGGPGGGFYSSGLPSAEGGGGAGFRGSPGIGTTYRGGYSAFDGSQGMGGGGSGAGNDGEDGNSLLKKAGDGGNGFLCSITGTPTFYGGGGGGGTFDGGGYIQGIGGPGGGGDAGQDATFYGGGGGGCIYSAGNPIDGIGGNGYQGIVILAYDIA